MDTAEIRRICAAAGLTGSDADTAIAVFMRKMLGRSVARAVDYHPAALMSIYGADAGRVAVILHHHLAGQ